MAGRLAPWNWQKPVVKPVPADHHGSSRGCPESRGASPRKDAPTQRHTTLRAMSGRSQSPETLSWNPQAKDPHSKAFRCFSQEKGGKNGHMSQKPSQRFEMFYCQTSFNVWKHDCAAIVQMRTLEAQTGYVSCLKPRRYEVTEEGDCEQWPLGSGNGPQVTASERTETGSSASRN